jgi:hypothetical protein
MYNTKVVCTYNTSDVFIETDNISPEEEEFVRDAIYRQELLNVFGLDEYNEMEIDTSISQLYKKVENCDELKECMLKLAGKFMSSNKEFGLIILYSYDYMYLTHICVSEFLENGKICEMNILKLKASIL